MGVLIAGEEAGNPGRDRDSLIGIPMPRHSWHPNIGAALDSSAACPAARRQVLWKVDFRQAAGQPEPPVVRHYTDLTPTGFDERFDSLKNEIDLLVNPAGELRLKGMPQLVELTLLGPGATVRITGFIRGEVLVASRSKQFAEAVRCQWLLAVRCHREKILPDRQSLDPL